MTIFKNNMISLYGQRGKKWLESLPGIAKSIADKYGLSGLTPITNLSYNYVMSGSQNNQPVVLKLSLDVEGLRQEAAALRAFAGFGAVNVLVEDDGLLLLERAIPGNTLTSCFPARDNEAILIACNVMKRLHQAPKPEAGTFPCIKDWLMAFNKDWNIPAQYLYKARQLRDFLLATADQPVLLHGDLHHDNILQNDHDWLVIDPKGVIGEPAYEAAAFIRNPIPQLLAQENIVNIIRQRITLVSTAINLPRERIFDWCFVQAILAWVWSLEDGYDATSFKQLAQVFDTK